MGNPPPEVTVQHRDDLEHLTDRLARVRFEPRGSLDGEILLALRRSKGAQRPQDAHPTIGLACGTLLLGLLIYLFWHAMLQAAR